ncbi:Cyclochlorotine biosynthesis protein R [Colletotrichum tropicale]|nr:Cyclochlorotine biosynthesis protein R [Colletotrichum tropicale]
MPHQTHYSEEEADERRNSDEKGNDSISSDTTLLLNDAEFVKWKQRGDSGLTGDYLDTAERHRHRGHYRHLISLLFLVSACLNVYLAFGRSPRVLTMHDVDVGCGAFPLGTDPSGYVPRNIGYPLRWTKWDEKDQFYISPKTFDSWENIQESAERLRAVHNDVFIHSNGQKATYLAYDGVRKELPPEAGQFGLELYGIQAFHQIHCVYVLLESVGWARHNRPSQWDGDHIAHCLNTMTQAATCLADSRPFAYVVPDGHRTDGQQNWCRDFGALVDWVNDPVRDHNFHYELDSNDTDHFMPIYRNGSIAGKPVDKSVC